jgi:nitrogen fixation protein FixH
MKRKRIDHNIRFMWGVMILAFFVIIAIAVFMVWAYGYYK